jgi:hypothetical protein
MKVAVECPGCGHGVEIEPGRRSAEMFCARCDYPLFWVSQPRSAESDEDTGDMVLRRLPGAAGIRLRATVPCPVCREHNAVIEVVCLRCGALMHPEPEPEPEPVPEAPPPPPPEPEPVAWWRHWMPELAALAAVVMFAVLVLIVWVLWRLAA